MILRRVTIFFTKHSNYDCIGIESPDVLNNFAMQISLILDSKHVIIWVSNSLYCQYFLMDGSTCENTQSRNFSAIGNLDLKTNS